MQLFIVDPYQVYKVIGALIAFLAIFFTCGSAAAAYGQGDAEKKDPSVFTEAERTKALGKLNETRTRLANELKGLSDKQLLYRSGPDRWTIAQVAEHIIIAEQRISTLIAENIVKGPEHSSPDVFRMNDTAIPLAITNRNQKFTAPPTVQPEGRWKTRDELLSEWEKSRAKTISFLKTTDVNLRTRFAENPVLGMIDAFQWIIFLDSHARRHLEQIAEVKAEPGYPTN
ncbi:MAG: DinB family protein [Aridibacter famidurans]|nr:DinB family protein [Aridibacter famidurans]